MMNYTRLIVPLTILALAAILLLAPTNARAALEHNLWALSAAKAAFGDNQAPTPTHNPHPHAYQWLARLAMESGDINLSNRWLSFLSDYRDPFVLDVLAHVLLLQGQPYAAFDLWREIEFTYGLEVIGREARENQDFQMAETAYKVAYEIDPERFTDKLSSLLSQFERYDEAVALLHESLDGYKKSDWRLNWWISLGDIYREKGDGVEAERAYRNALSEYPKSVNARIRLGWLIYDTDEDIDKAIDYFKQAIEINPDNGAGYYAIGFLLYQEKRYDDSTEWLNQAVMYSPHIPGYHRIYARSLMEAGQIDLSIEAYENYVNQFPHSAVAYYEISDAYLQNTYLPEAVEAIETALLLLNSPSISYYLRAGEIYEVSGEFHKAFAVYKKVLEIDPDQREARHAIERLIRDD